MLQTFTRLANCLFGAVLVSSCVSEGAPAAGNNKKCVNISMLFGLDCMIIRLCSRPDC